MADIRIIKATPGHLIELLHDLEGLNEEDKYRFGVDKKEILLKIFERSIFVDAAMIDDKIAGIWGVVGEYLGNVGRPWSLLSPFAEKYPFRLTSHYREAIEKMARLFPVLVDMVDARHSKIIRMLKIMGFTFEEPKPFMNSLYIKATRRM